MASRTSFDASAFSEMGPDLVTFHLDGMWSLTGLWLSSSGCSASLGRAILYEGSRTAQEAQQTSGSFNILWLPLCFSCNTDSSSLWSIMTPPTHTHTCQLKRSHFLGHNFMPPKAMSTLLRCSALYLYGEHSSLILSRAPPYITESPLGH